MKNIPNEVKNIEEEFFEIDKKEKIARIELAYAKPEDIFEDNIRIKIPTLNEDFMQLIIRCFEYVKDDYKLDIDIFFDDLDGYNEEELNEICKKNLLLQANKHLQDNKRHNRLVLTLFTLGLIIVFFAVVLDYKWQTQSLFRKIVAFVLEIVATVPFWAAADLYFVAGTNRRRRIANFIRRCDAITFHRNR